MTTYETCACGQWPVSEYGSRCPSCAEMKEWEVTIEGHIADTFVVEADSAEEASARALNEWVFTDYEDLGVTEVTEVLRDEDEVVVMTLNEYVDGTGRGVRQLPWEQADPAVYEVLVEDEVVGHMRYDDGWRWLLDGPRSTVDRERLLSLRDVEELEHELGFEPDTLLRCADWAREGES